MEEVAYAKGTRILRAGKTERNLFFIKKGIVRAFVSTQGREITFWLGAEGTPVVSMKSYVSGLPGYESVECIEDTVLLRAAPCHADIPVCRRRQHCQLGTAVCRKGDAAHRRKANSATVYHCGRALQLTYGQPPGTAAPRSAGAPGFLSRSNAGEPEPHQGDSEMKRLHRHHVPLPQA